MEYYVQGKGDRFERNKMESFFSLSVLHQTFDADIALINLPSIVLKLFAKLFYDVIKDEMVSK